MMEDLCPSGEECRRRGRQFLIIPQICYDARQLGSMEYVRVAEFCDDRIPDFVRRFDCSLDISDEAAFHDRNARSTQKLERRPPGKCPAFELGETLFHTELI
ncbi:hypothetical protein ACVW0I_000002 [Bradyrhizobium sp. LM6.11]